MTEEEWKLSVVRELGEIKTEVKNINKRIPVCEKRYLFAKASTNRRMIYSLYFALGTVAFFVFKKIFI